MCDGHRQFVDNDRRCGSAAPHKATLEAFFLAISRPHHVKLFHEQGVSYGTLLTLQDEDLGVRWRASTSTLAYQC
jgi:hypothetical protein